MIPRFVEAIEKVVARNDEDVAGFQTLIEFGAGDFEFGEPEPEEKSTFTGVK